MEALGKRNVRLGYTPDVLNDAGQSSLTSTSARRLTYMSLNDLSVI